MHVGDEGVVVGEHVAVGDARVGLVVALDHPLDEARERVHVHHDAGREHDAVAFGRVERDHRFAHLAHARRGRDLLGGLPRVDHGGAQPRVQALVVEVVLRLEAKLRHAVVVARGFEDLSALAERVDEREPLGPDAAALRRLCRGLDRLVHERHSFALTAARRSSIRRRRRSCRPARPAWSRDAR